jgi:hypothetical protein
VIIGHLRPLHIGVWSNVYSDSEFRLCAHVAAPRSPIARSTAGTG